MPNRYGLYRGPVNEYTPSGANGYDDLLRNIQSLGVAPVPPLQGQAPTAPAVPPAVQPPTPQGEKFGYDEILRGM